MDQTLARFSAVHDEIADEERRRRERRSRFVPWLGADEEMEAALSSPQLPSVPDHDHGDSGIAAFEPGGSDTMTRLQAKKRRKHHRLATVPKVVAVVVAVLIFGVTGFAWGAMSWLDSKFHFIDALDQDAAAIRNAAGQLGDQNFLLVGSDTRLGASPDDNAGTAATVSGARADTVMVAHIGADLKRVIVVSFPRDLEVDRKPCRRWDPKNEGYTDQRVPPATNVKLNSVYAVGGPKCLTRTIQRISGLKINHFAGINFGGFKEMVDAVGGVQVCSTKPIKDSKLGVVLPKAGPQVISGTQALNYVRARHVDGDPTSGYGRMHRQQRFLSSLLRKVLSRQVLLDPGKLKNFVGAFANATFGENIGVDQLLTLARSMRGFDSHDVTFVTVPTTGYANSRGNEVLRPKANDALFNAIINDTPLPGDKPANPSDEHAQASPQPHKVLPHDVKIQVLNGGNPTTGIAGRTADTLAERGFQIMQVQNAQDDVNHTVIRYAMDATAKARTLASAVPSAHLREDPSAEGAVILTLGPDFDGLGGSGHRGSAPASAAQNSDPGIPGRPLSTINAANTTCPDP